MTKPTPILVLFLLAAVAAPDAAGADGWIVKTAKRQAPPSGEIAGAEGDYVLTINANMGFVGFGTYERFDRPCAIRVLRVMGNDGGYDDGIRRGEYGSLDVEEVWLSEPCKDRGLTADPRELVPFARLDEGRSYSIVQGLDLCASKVGVQKPPSIKGYEIWGRALRRGADTRDRFVRTNCLDQDAIDRADWMRTGCGRYSIPTTLYLHFAESRRRSRPDRLVGVDVGCSGVQLAYVYNVGHGADDSGRRFFDYDIRHVIGRERPTGGGGSRDR